MNSASVRINQLWQSVKVSSFQFDQVPVLDDLPGKLVHLGELLEDFLVGACSGFCFLEDWQAEFVEENRAKLLRRIDVEFFVGQFVNFVDQLVNA